MLLSLLTSLALAQPGSAPSPVPAGSADPPSRPNILFILADDLGLEGIGAYGSDLFQTPHIDRLAREGMLFTSAFVNPYCTPTRTELLTGRYPFATGTGYVIWDYARHHRQVLDPSQPSFARQLQRAGYATAIAGKWQMSFLSTQDWVHQFGFDTYMLWQIATAEGERTTRFHRPHYRMDGRVIAREIEDRYGPDVLVDFIVDFMRESNAAGKPFMAYYTALLPHYPWVPTPASADQTVPADSRDGHGVPKFYPDMVMRLDHDVGRLLGALDAMGVAGNTVVIFLADNGTDQHLFGSIHGRLLYGGKATLTDRGTRVPMLVRWPGRIAAGSFDTELLEAADFLPTLCEIAGAPLPEQPIHGVSFAARLLNRRIEAKPKPWVHLQRGDVRYLRTRDWIVRGPGAYERVQPYPFDAIAVPEDELSEAERDRLGQLARTLVELAEKPFGRSPSRTE